MMNSQRNTLLRKLSLVFWLSLLLLVSTLLNNQIQMGIRSETNILKLLPKVESNPLMEVAFKNYAEKNMRQIVFLIKSRDQNHAVDLASQFAEMLEKSQWIDSVDSKIDADEQSKVGELFFKYRYSLLTKADRLLLQQHHYDVFSDDVAEIVFSPLSGSLASIAQEDPFFLSYRYLQNSKLNSNFELNKGYLVSKYQNDYYILIRAKLNGSPFDRTVQINLLDDIKQFENTFILNNGVLGSNNQNRDKASLIRAGGLFYGALAFETAKKEISTIGVSSLFLIIGMVLFVFRSIKPLVLVSVALLFGIVSGFVFTLELFGEIHLLTMVFGASLIGVAVDYGFHFLVIDSSYQGFIRLRKIFPAISLGLMSSVVGYLALLSTPFPGLQQMAVFCIVGLLGAFLTVVLIFPLMTFKNALSPRSIYLCQLILNFKAWKHARQIWLVLWLFPIGAGLVIFNSKMGQDDIRKFQTTNNSLKEQEKLIKTILGPDESNVFYLVTGDSQQDLLTNMMLAQPKFESLVLSGVISGFRNLSNQLPSIEQQKKNHQLILELFQSNAVETLLEFGIIDPQRYFEIKNKLALEEQQYLLPTVWFDSLIGRAFSHFWLGKIEGKYSAVISLRGINDIGKLSDIDENTLFVDKDGEVSNVLGQYRKRTSYLLIASIVLAWFVLSFRYGLKKSLVIVSSPVFSISITIIVLSMLGVSMTLFNTLALFLVVGIGIDYGLFFAESDHPDARILLAISLSALTTIFSFGLLALSETLAIHTFGLTMLLGISSVFMLSPMIGSLVVIKKRVCYESN